MLRLLCSLLVLSAIAALAAPAEAGHGVVAFRNTPFRGPVPTNNLRRADFFVAGHHAVFAPFAVRSSYALPYYAPPLVVAPPVTYVQPAPVVTYQSYSAGYAPQAYSAGQVYVLPDGRSVLPDGRVINP